MFFHALFSHCPHTVGPCPYMCTHKIRAHGACAGHIEAVQVNRKNKVTTGVHVQWCSDDGICSLEEIKQKTLICIQSVCSLTLGSHLCGSACGVCTHTVAYPFKWDAVPVLSAGKRSLHLFENG